MSEPDASKCIKCSHLIDVDVLEDGTTIFYCDLSFSDGPERCTFVDVDRDFIFTFGEKE